MLPTVVLAHMNPSGPAARSNQLNIGDQIININGISLVGLPLSAAQANIKNVKWVFLVDILLHDLKVIEFRTATAVRLTVVSTPPVVEVRIRRPDTKYQLGFSVQNGVICSLLRGKQASKYARGKKITELK
ncbi:Protein lin-10 [Parelaphostrongylus tenuis]|uniref:Protein lin-10 n=1 Tax=Parelaphostrongylus tenuis TaxID=148309 RepID=A0AAD5WJS2_PARTN|nr:Protein lin-10 [Parelaphostrongylus tenuis]